ncbi:reverse transcriptase family protein, partial [Acinetobacter baumannii]
MSELDSDHRPVVMQLGRPLNREPDTRTMVDWKKLGTCLADTAPPILPCGPDSTPSPEDTVESINIFTDHVSTAITRSSKQVDVEDCFHRIRLSPDLRDLVRVRNAAIRAYDRYPTDSNRTRMRRLQREVKSRLSDARNENWDSYLEELAPTHQAYWQLARTLKSETIATMPPLVRPSGQSPAYDDDDKAELLADALQEQCTTSTQHADPEHTEFVDREVERRASLPPSDALPPITTSEVKEAIDSLQPRKAPGSDGIRNRALKLLPAQLITMLATILNAAMTNCIFPAAWKEADVIGIHKPGKPKNETASYRPISLLPAIGKLYERLLRKRLWDFVSANKILIDEQFGFRARHSCVHQVHRLTEHILLGLNRRKPIPTGALFFDIAKAFDKVWHNGLIYKLYNMGVPDRLVLIIRDYLSNRSFRYRVEGTRSRPRHVTAGVPQGSALSPLL